ncbi:germination protein YpeB [Inediibacterium massiliense]|uniref:germination protein YpeB n=1 Tax=Inediibacterium massiliense TaxID=1658111 RepID=UPI0006B53C31|nr:germination protein YpeB [Inediibacterium massiliense]
MKKSLLALIAVFVLGTGIWGYTQYKENQSYSITLENQFQRMFQDMVVDVENIQVNLSKIMITGAAKQNVLLLSETSHLCYDAQEKLTQLPLDHKNVSKTQKFLSQVGDLSISLARKNLEGKPLNIDEKETLEELHNYSNYLSQEFISLQNNMFKQGLKIGELRKKANQNLKKMNSNLINTSLVNIEERMQKYPELIYDGPFSEHIKNKKLHKKGRTIGKDEAINIAKYFCKDSIKYDAKIISESNDTKIPVYVVELTPQKGDYTITIAITKIEGKVLWMIDTREVGKIKISEKQGVTIATDYLNKIGYINMVPTYFEKYDGQLIINFAYKKDEMIAYTDLIKVKVGLDEGKVLGLETEGYLLNHHERTFSKPKITRNEAMDQISNYAQTSRPRLVIIPTEGGKEVLCYEIKATYKQDTFLVYINADTGEEQKILQVIVKKDGVLMM